MSQQPSSEWTPEERIKTALEIVKAQHALAASGAIKPSDALAFANRLYLILSGQPDRLNLRIAEIMDDVRSPMTMHATDSSYTEVTRHRPGRSTYQVVARRSISIDIVSLASLEPDESPERQT